MQDVIQLVGKRRVLESYKAVRTIPHIIEFGSLKSTLRFFQQCIHLSARTSTGPGRGFPRGWHNGVGYLSISFREVLYCRSGAFQERVLLSAPLAPCRSEGGWKSTFIGQLYSEGALDKAQESR